MFRLRLTAKITVLIVVVLIIGFGASTIFTIRRESDLLVEQSKESARRLISTVVASIEAAMLQERPDITRGLVQDLKSSSRVEGLTIYRRNGVEAFTGLVTLREVSKEAGLSKDVVASIERMRREPGRTMTGPLFQRAIETLRTQEALETRDGVSLFVLNQPIVNQERCQGCHGTDHEVRAVVRVATSMEPVLAQVEMQRNRQIMIGATKLGGAGSQRRTFTATGPTTNLAARFAGSAEGGDIVVGPVTAERIRTRFVLDALGEKSFKNVSQPLAVYRVIPPGIYSGVKI